MRTLLCALCFLFLQSLSLTAQISGVVMDARSREPLTGANVYILNTAIGTTTDTEGYFRLNDFQASAADTLIIAFVGYTEQGLSLAGYRNPLTIYLVPAALQLGESIESWADRLDLARQEMPHITAEVRAAEIERYGSSEISDVFKKIPAVRLEGNDIDGRQIQIRGSDASEVNVYLDGILINDPGAGNAADLTMIPVDNIHKLEVLKGGSLPLMGSGAFGGVINIISRQEIESNMQFKSRIGSFETKSHQLSLNVPVKKNLYFSFFGQTSVMKPEIEYFPSERFSEKTAASEIETDKTNLSLNLDYFISGGRLNARMYLYNLDYTKPGWMDSRQNLLTALAWNSGNNFTLSLSQTFGRDEVDRSTVATTHYLYDYDTRRLNLRATQKLDLKRIELNLLGEYFHDELENISRLRNQAGTSTYYRSELYDNRLAGAAVFSFSERIDSLGNKELKTFLGLREDLTASGYSQFTNNFGINFEYRRNRWSHRPFLSYGKNVRFPTLIESAYAGELNLYTAGDTIRQALEPEYNSSWELGAETEYLFQTPLLRSFNLSLSFFHNQIYNKILTRPFGDALVQSQIGRNTTRGLEASASLKEIWASLNLTASAMTLDISDKLLYDYKPESSLSLQADYFHPAGFYLTALYFIEGRSYAWYYDQTNQLRTLRIDGNWDVDLSAGYRFRLGGFEFNLQTAGYNLFDNSSFDYYFLRKKFIQVSLSVKHG